MQLRRREGVHEPCLGNNKQQHLGAGQNRKLVCLLHNTCLPLGKSDVSPGLLLDEPDFDLSAFSLVGRLGVLVLVVLELCVLRLQVEARLLGRLRLLF
ncbi:UNVERIFIED_CONTAM: hypothetical protein ACS92_05830 [Bacillus cereus]